MQYNAEVSTISAKTADSSTCVMLANQGTSQSRVCSGAGCAWDQLGFSTARASKAVINPTYCACRLHALSLVVHSLEKKRWSRPGWCTVLSQASATQANQLDKRIATPSTRRYSESKSERFKWRMALSLYLSIDQRLRFGMCICY